MREWLTGRCWLLVSVRRIARPWGGLFYGMIVENRRLCNKKL